MSCEDKKAPHPLGEWGWKLCQFRMLGASPANEEGHARETKESERGGLGDRCGADHVDFIKHCLIT